MKTIKRSIWSRDTTPTDIRGMSARSRDAFGELAWDVWHYIEYANSSDSRCQIFETLEGRNIVEVGHIVIALSPPRVAVIDLIVNKEKRRQGFGTSILDALATVYRRHRKFESIIVPVSERNEEAQYFLRGRGMRCVSYERKACLLTGEAILLFELPLHARET